MTPPWSRPEPFGAWVRLDDRTLVAVDHALAARLGVRAGEALGVARPLEVHLAVTQRCFSPCEGCYMGAHPDGAEPSQDELCARLEQMRDGGVSTVAFGGGEPLLRKDIGELARIARSFGMVPVMTTSGLGLTDERARELGAFAQINVSHDGTGGGYARVRGFEGQGPAERAIAILARAGIAVGVNFVLTRGSFEHLVPTCERVADLGAGEIQLLRYKPQGRAAGMSYLERRLGPGEIDRLWPAITAIVRAGRLRVRIDCAMVPLLSEALLASTPRPAETLASLGVLGCEAGRHLGAVDVEGRAAPCSFVPAGDGELARFRAHHAAPPEPCVACPLLSVCRGGCQVVSRHAQHAAFAPDPECPRVRAHVAAGAETRP
jgi:radical SAM protein with 4Fe4S-binding SPASM domain